MSYANLTEAERTQKVKEALEQAEKLRRERRYDEGIELLIEALKYGAEKAQIYFRLGNLYFDTQKLEHAEYAYRRAIDFDPKHINAHYNLGVVYKKQGRISEYIKMRKLANTLALRYPEQMVLSPDQVKRARSFANRLLVFAGLVIVAIALALFLLTR